MTDPRQPWQPDQRKLGNWAAMFDSHARDATPLAQPAAPEAEIPIDAEAPGIDLTKYRPWQLQRGGSRPAMMLELRRYEPRSGLWSSTQLSYPTLLAVEYTGDRLLSLDFGTRQFMIEGHGLDELTHHFQRGSVLALQEYAAAIWPVQAEGPVILTIKRVD